MSDFLSSGRGSPSGTMGAGGASPSGAGRPGPSTGQGGGASGTPPGSGSTPPPSGGGSSGGGGRQGGPQSGAASPMTAAMFELAKTAAQQGSSSQVTDAITQALLAILGSGPSIAAFESLMSINAANGMMYYNAVDHQQKTNLLGMAMTAKCVRYMLDPPSYDGFSEAVAGTSDPAAHG